MSDLRIIQVAALTDNYNYILHEPNSGLTAVVDPSEFSPIDKALSDNGLSLDLIIHTHHHHDHIGGDAELVKKFDCEIVGPKYDQHRIPNMGRALVDGDRFELGQASARVFYVPGHTLGHIAYFTNKTLTPVLFCGDTLFSGGCGRIFEGTAEQMLASLSKLANLPDNTSVYCAHEYTQANLKFALTVDPNNEALINYNNKVAMLRDNNQSTVPTTIKLEKLINPFLRSHETALQQSANDYNSMCHTNSLDTFTTIRRWKDQF